MSWLILAIVSYFLNAVVAVTDKFLLSRKVKDPLVYTFYVGILSSAALLLWPFDFSFLSPSLTLVALVAGASFFIAIFFFYSAVMAGEVSRVVPVVGGVSPLVVFGLSYLFFGERLPVLWFLGFTALILGTFSFLFEKDGRTHIYSFAAAVFFALSFFATKAVFLKTSFLNGFIWARMGTVLLAVLVLLVPFFRKLILQSQFSVKRRLFLLFISNKALGSLAFIVLNYAIALGSVTIVNALQGVQYVFLFFLAIIFSSYFPQVLQESLHPRAIAQKILGIVLISFGVIILFIS